MIVLSYTNSLFVKVKSFEMLNSQKINDCVGWETGEGGTIVVMDYVHRWLERQVQCN